MKRQNLKDVGGWEKETTRAEGTRMRLKRRGEGYERIKRGQPGVRITTYEPAPAVRTMSCENTMSYANLKSTALLSIPLCHKSSSILSIRILPKGRILIECNIDTCETVRAIDLYGGLQVIMISISSRSRNTSPKEVRITGNNKVIHFLNHRLIE